jgi:hypothetical protein
MDGGYLHTARNQIPGGTKSGRASRPQPRKLPTSPPATNEPIIHRHTTPSESCSSTRGRWAAPTGRANNKKQHQKRRTNHSGAGFGTFGRSHPLISAHTHPHTKGRLSVRRATQRALQQRPLQGRAPYPAAIPSRHTPIQGMSG